MAGERWLTEQKRSGIVRAFTLNDREQYPAIHGGANGCFSIRCSTSLGRGRLSATLRQSLQQVPRRKADVHSRWCSLHATLGWIGSEWGWGRVLEQLPHTRVRVHKTCHMSSRMFSNPCDPELDIHRPEIRRLEDRSSRRNNGLRRRLAGATGNHMGHLHFTGSTSPSRSSVLSRGLVMHTLAPSNRD